ncbi:MAG: GTP-binding protein [Mesorhizobium sp.]|uniref:CobW family GTP-binding protein n=1 Tax=Mesorhizobium sp. TaxID=1871066 RepID=UPI001205BA7D|nr:GTP-binding protein [Mesorhizobium sp.]TIP27019.1 MAG: GTP-binding protein [Mesorhizobium sp.]
MGKLKTSILTGFLGAGKTTLLNHLLSTSQHERIAVIVNEYGEVGIDGKLVVEAKDEIIELNNGCICCTVRSDLISAIQALLASGRPIDRIVIETSGLADPAPVIQSFVLDEVLAERLQLDAIITVVDARHVERHMVLDEAMEQISFADVLLLNKTDLESRETLALTERKLRHLNPLARIIRTQSSVVDRSAVLDIGAFDLKNILSIDPDILEEHDHEHDQSVGCVAIREPGPLDPTMFNAWVNRLLQASGKDMFRMKGVLQFEGDPRRYVFHGVHMTLEGRPGKAWMPSEQRMSEIVFIGRNLDDRSLRSGFANCLAHLRELAS